MARITTRLMFHSRARRFCRDHQGRRRLYVEVAAGVTNKLHRFTYDDYVCVARNREVDVVHGVGTDDFVWDPTELIATRPLMCSLATPQSLNSSAFFYSLDGNKNVTELVGEDGDLAAHYEYSAFGKTLLSLSADGLADKLNPWRFSSEYADDALGLVYYNYRHYNSVDGKWARRDPKYESPYSDSSIPNLYLWCDNQYNNVDVLGLKCIIYRFMGHYAGVNESNVNDIRTLLSAQDIDSCDAVFSISCHMDDFLIAATNTNPNVKIPLGWPPVNVQNPDGKIFGGNIAALLKASDGQVSDLKSQLSDSPCCCSRVTLRTVCDKDINKNIDDMIRLQKRGISVGGGISSNPCGKDVEL